MVACRDVVGDCARVGDERWAGSYGVEADFVARDNCSVMWADLHDVEVGIFWEGGGGRMAL